jgi:hypothetical protein
LWAAVLHGGLAESPNTLRAAVKDSDERIADLAGQLYDPDGTHRADEKARLRDLILGLNANLRDAHIEINNLRRSLDAARGNVKRERVRNVTRLFAGQSDHS